MPSSKGSSSHLGSNLSLVCLLALAGRSFTTTLTGKPLTYYQLQYFREIKKFPKQERGNSLNYHYSFMPVKPTQRMKIHTLTLPHSRSLVLNLLPFAFKCMAMCMQVLLPRPQNSQAIFLRFCYFSSASDHQRVQKHHQSCSICGPDSVFNNANLNQKMLNYSRSLKQKLLKIYLLNTYRYRV